MGGPGATAAATSRRLPRQAAFCRGVSHSQLILQACCAGRGRAYARPPCQSAEPASRAFRLKAFSRISDGSFCLAGASLPGCTAAARLSAGSDAHCIAQPAALITPNAFALHYVWTHGAVPRQAWEHSFSVHGLVDTSRSPVQSAGKWTSLAAATTDLQCTLYAALRAESRGSAQASLGAQLQRGGLGGQAAQLHGGRAHQDAADLHAARDARLRRQPETRTGAHPCCLNQYQLLAKVSCSAVSYWPTKFLPVC